MDLPFDVLLAAGDEALRRAVPGDDGRWRTTPVLDLDVRALAADPHDPRRAWAGTQGDGVHVTDDGGRTWRPAGLEGEVVKSLAPSPADPDLVWAGVKPADLHVSRDGGTTWDLVDGFHAIPSRRFWRSPAEPPWTGYVSALAASPADPDHVVAGVEVGGVLASFDGGAEWTRGGGAILDCHTLAHHPADPDVLLQGGAGFRKMATRTSDAGRTWTPVRGERGYGWAVAPHPADPHVGYASAAPGPGKAHGGGPADAHVYRVEDGDAHRVLPEGDGGMDAMPYALLTHPSTPDTLVVVGSDGSVRASPDRGGTWSRTPVDLGAGVWAAVGLAPEATVG